MTKTRVLFVCLGNICRSPAAEAVFQKKIDDAQLTSSFVVDSAGTSAYHAGEKADARVREQAKKRGIDVTSISRQFLKEDFTRFDYIIVMDDSNYENVLSLDIRHEYHHKVHKMTDYCSSKFSGFEHIPDPYYGADDGFNLVLDLLDDACQGLYNKLS